MLVTQVPVLLFAILENVSREMSVLFATHFHAALNDCFHMLLLSNVVIFSIVSFDHGT